MKNSITMYALLGALSLSPGMYADSVIPDNADFFADGLVNETDLDGHRGEGIDLMTINEIVMSGTNENNTAINNLTGDNSISGDSFVGASGMFDVIQNTGNNVLIQKSTIVNITVVPELPI